MHTPPFLNCLSGLFPPFAQGEQCYERVLKALLIVYVCVCTFMCVLRSQWVTEFFAFIILCMSVGTCVLLCTSGSQRTTRWKQSSPSIMWVLEIELRLSSLVASTLIY